MNTCAATAICPGVPPSVETLGYYRLSLRDNNNTFSLEITAPQKPVSKVLRLI
jgi:hypothetical protein